MLAYLWEAHHAGELRLAGKAYPTFELLALMNTASYDAYALAVELGWVSDQPDILCLN